MPPLCSEKPFDKTPDVSLFRVFGCQVFMYLEKPMRIKIESIALEGFLICYRNNSKSSLIEVFDGAELITKSSRNIKFNETSIPGKTHFANTESDSDIFFELNKMGVNRVAKHGASRRYKFDQRCE